MRIQSIFKWALAILLLGAVMSCGPKMTPAKISVNHDIKTIQEGDMITLTTTGTKGAFYKWTGPNGQTNSDTTSSTWTINMIGDAVEYTGLYSVTEYTLKGNKMAYQSKDTVTLNVKGIPLCTRVSGTRFAFIKAGKYKLSIKDVDIRTTTLTGYSLCLEGPNCTSLDPNSNNSKCFERPSGSNSFIVSCTGDCPFAIIYTELHNPGGEAQIVDNDDDLAKNILSFDNGKGLSIKVKVERVR